MVLSERVAGGCLDRMRRSGRDLGRRDPHTVCGVVENVSKVANTAYAEAWVPYTCE